MDALLLVSAILGATALLSVPIGRYMAWAMDPGTGGRRAATRLSALFATISGARGQQDWRRYVATMLVFNACMFAVCFAILSLQQWLPLNPDAKGALTPDLVFNTTASFTTNTNLQHYSGEVSLSYLSQLAALMWLQFVSAATGIAALAALARGIAGRADMGHFLIDVQRASFLVLLPIALVVALTLVVMGVPMTLDGAAQAVTLEGVAQTIARGPVAAFVAIKQLGTNGGGFFGPNSTHPLENVSFWSNALQMLSIIIIPMACVWMFGRLIGRPKHALVVFCVMLGFICLKITGSVWFEGAPAASFAGLPIEQAAEPRGQGTALRHRRWPALGGADHVHVQRLDRGHA